MIQVVDDSFASHCNNCHKKEFSIKAVCVTGENTSSTITFILCAPCRTELANVLWESARTTGTPHVPHDWRCPECNCSAHFARIDAFGVVKCHNGHESL